MSSTPMVGAVFAGRFRIQELIGQGGMGSVYRAKHLLLHRTVAIKVLRSDLAADQRTVARFQREARMAGRLDHPNVTSTLDFGYTEQGRPYLVMEHVEGPTLREVIERDGPLPVQRAVDLLTQIARAVAAAHARGVVHRDLKPDNILVTTDHQGKDRVKITDFGLAKQADLNATSLTLAGTTHGTPTYMSPEQCRGEHVELSSDIYSFGVLAFELLVGAPPFTGSLWEVVRAHLAEAPRAPSKASGRRDIPALLDRLILRCLDKQPADRFQSAAQLVEELESVPDQEPTAPRLDENRESARSGIKCAVLNFIEALGGNRVATTA